MRRHQLNAFRIEGRFVDAGILHDNAQQVELIRHFLRRRSGRCRGKLAERFYARFFELAPDARALFPVDMERQNLKLMDMIAAIVGAIENRDIFPLDHPRYRT